MPFISLILLVVDGRVPQLKEIYLKEISKKWTNKEILVIFSKQDLIPNPKLENSFDLRKPSSKKHILKLIYSKLKSLTLSSKESTNSLIIMGGANSGKSSLINLLVGSKKVKKSPEAGTTRNITRHKIPSTDLLVYDSPGLFPSRLHRELKILFQLLNFLPATEGGKEIIGEWAYNYLWKLHPQSLKRLIPLLEAEKVTYQFFLNSLAQRYRLIEKRGEYSLELAERKFLQLIRSGLIGNIYWNIKSEE
ncbi:ribosome biogenesis GTP-binding protein YlqF [Mycoplasma ovis str. Michigan]|uniref:Ribosome biogenesis GTP-binding protein YlqF n=2 Tax=Mycoplasma ovis TaxID=171632 RepID=A0ABN4BR17_9MOLU|nr:ribosome biogenesis GTP-binding protein YlqF [Mycoplasma ovis str. Michigan]